MPSLIVLSHEEQRERLRLGCPEAVPVSVVAGDPCIDQLRASMPFRESYRQALGVGPGRKLVVVSSTWGPGSVLGSAAADVLRRVLAELPADEYRAVVAVHPNAWYGHGAWQLQSWLAPLLDSGLMLPVPATQTWKAALLAADVLIGDHGSLTFYGAALGVPCLLASFPSDVVAAGSPMERLGQLLPTLVPGRPLLSQLGEAIAGGAGNPELERLSQMVTSRPGRSATLLRRLFYEFLRLPEPAAPAATSLVPLPEPLPPARRAPGLPPMFVSVAWAEAVGDRDGDRDGDGDGESDAVATVRRYPAALQDRAGRHLAAAHLVADAAEPDIRWSRAADVLLLPLGRTPASSPPRMPCWDEFSGRHPGCSLIAVAEPEDGCLALLPDGRRIRARWHERPDWASFAIAGSLVHDYVYAHDGATKDKGPRAPFRVQVVAGQLLERGLLVISEL
ncbi:hypothetical protein ACTPOK_35815 [Streptomyces inhibens]|uniref:hypothetical protein n=1 Tax=Streptomyces inhibens TaxID=2293571 RepID=UPI00402AF2ED